MILLHAVVALAFAQDADQAQALHTEMMAAVLNASTLQFGYKCEAKSKGVLLKTAQGKILMETPGNFYQEFEVKTGDKVESMTTVSDGVSLKYGDNPPKPALDTTLKNIKGIVSLMGLSTHYFNKAVRGLPPKMSAYSLGKKSTFDGNEAQAVSYAIDFGKPEITVTTTVWIDLKTKLPLKRSTHLKAGGDEADFSDTFTGIKSGEKIDPKWFVVPK
jgi:outer membrane lipoprotein-sorting protein